MSIKHNKGGRTNAVALTGTLVKYRCVFLATKGKVSPRAATGQFTEPPNLISPAIVKE